MLHFDDFALAARRGLFQVLERVEKFANPVLTMSLLGHLWRLSALEGATLRAALGLYGFFGRMAFTHEFNTFYQIQNDRRRQAVRGAGLVRCVLAADAP